MIKGDPKSRVVFHKGFQKRLFDSIKERLGRGWYTPLRKILKRSDAVLHGYSCEKYKLSLKQLNLLSRMFDLDESIIASKVKILQPENWGSIKAASVTNTRYRKELGEWGRKGAYKIQELYPKERLKWIEKGIRKAGKIGAASQPLNFLELKVAKYLPKTDLEIHKTIENGNQYFNVDFICNGLPIEVVSIPHNRGEMFCRILDYVSKSKQLNKQLFVVVEDFYSHPDAILLALEEGLIPISIKDLRKFNRYLIKKDFRLLDALEKKAELESKKAIEMRQNQMFGAAKREILKYDLLERSVNRNISHLNPNGKTILKNRYGTFAVPDNYINFGNKRYAFLVTKRSGKTSSIRAALRDHAGYAYMLKKLYGNYKVISVIAMPKMLQLKFGRAFRFYEKYIDHKIIGNEEEVLNKLKRLDLNRLGKLE